MFLRLLFLLLPLMACTPREDVINRFDDWTGFTESYTREQEIFRDRRGIMTARPVIISRDGQRGYGVLTNIRRRVPNGPIVEQMWSGSTPLNYISHDRLRSHCIDGCQTAEVGVITLSEAAFRAAAVTGLPLRVQGRRGRYAGTVPAVLFQRVLATGTASPLHSGSP